MNLFLSSLLLFLVASTSHALRVPVSRFKLPGFSPLENWSQDYGGTSHNVLATTDSSGDLTSVYFLNYSANVLIRVWVSNVQDLIYLANVRRLSHL